MKIKINGLEIAGIVWFTLSVLVFAYTDNNANACSNAFIGAVASQQCTPWMAFHTLSIACMWLAGIGTSLAIAYNVYKDNHASE